MSRENNQSKGADTESNTQRDKRYKAETALDIRGQPTKYCEGWTCKKENSSKESSHKMVSEKAAGLPHMGSSCNMYPLLSCIWLWHTNDTE